MAKLDPWTGEPQVNKIDRDRVFKKPPIVSIIAILIIVISFANFFLLIVWLMDVDQDQIRAIALQMTYECFLIYVAVSIFNGKNWARLTWLWLMFVVLLLKSIVEQSYGPIQYTPIAKILFDLRGIVWLVSLLFLNSKVVKTYFRRYEFNERELAAVISDQDKLVNREKYADKDKYTRMELKQQLGREPTDEEVKEADKEKWME